MAIVALITCDVLCLQVCFPRRAQFFPCRFEITNGVKKPDVAGDFVSLVGLVLEHG